MPGLTVGLLEDELPQAELVTRWLAEAGYQVTHCTTGGSFLDSVRAAAPDMLILDWQLPDCEGTDVLLQLRGALGYAGPALFATAKDTEDDVVQGLACGADDYLIKPLRRAELLARLEALWRRIGHDDPGLLALGPIELDQCNKLARVNGEQVELTATEFKLAVCVLANAGKLLSREFLLKNVWGVGSELNTRTVDVHMSRLRKILKIGPDMGYCIKTIYRYGYRLEAL